MYALRVLYQRHRKLAPWVGAMVALFFVTLIATMPVPRADAAQSAVAPILVPVAAETPKAGALATLLSHQRLENADDAPLAFVPSTRPF